VEEAADGGVQGLIARHTNKISYILDKSYFFFYISF